MVELFDDIVSGTILDGQYRVLKKLGEGSFGVVFKVAYGTDIYALKILKLWKFDERNREKVLARFDMEYKTGKIDSPYLVHSYTAGMISGNPYILMEFCPNGDLSKASESTDWEKVFLQILYGLRVLHSNGKVHRDLKPENVLIRENGVAALTDFGISGDRHNRMTDMGVNGAPVQKFGTLAYMPPEQLNPGDREVTILPTTDIFSFGVMAYWLLIGELPFGKLEQNNQDDLVRYTSNARNGIWNREALRKAWPSFYEAIEGCLQPDYTKRLQSIDAVLAKMPGGAIDIDRPPKNLVGPVKYSLRVMQGEEYGKIYDLTQMFSRMNFLTAGRRDPSVANDISIKEQMSNYISRKQFTITKKDDSFFIIDGQRDIHAPSGWKNSTNGTFVNSTEVTKAGYPLSIGDIISVGDVKMRFETSDLNFDYYASR